MTIRTLMAASVTLAMTAPALAATDGALGPTSTGTADVSVTLIAAANPEVQIYRMDDLSFTSDIQADFTGPISSTQGNACVWTPSETAFAYTLDVSAPDMTGQNDGESMPYDLLISTEFVYEEDFPETAYASGSSTISVSDLALSNEQTCQESGASLFYRVEIDPASAGFPTTPDTYAATLTFTVAPE